MDLKLEKIIKMKSLTILCILLILVIETVSCRPNHKPPPPRTQTQDIVAEFHDMDPAEFEQIRKCHEDDDTMELCQRCAKATKVRNAFPMCCSNEDGVQDWCKDYVYYGIQY